MDDATPQIAAIRTIAASGLTMLLARLFGRRTVTRDGEWQWTAAKWRGKIYMLDHRNVGPVDADAPF